jgi:dTDP-4-amino-4,6-dideoxygalactose transaminase
MIKFLDLQKQYDSMRVEIDEAIRRVIESSVFIGGPEVARFEERFGAYHHVDHCVGVANGTDALEIALEALELLPQSEVIVPANTFIATAEAVTRTGHNVVFADVDAVTYTLDPADVERRINPRTRAIVAVHLYGHPCDMVALDALARRYDLKIVEDCAQAHGAEYGGRRVGGFGAAACFSFYPGKNLGAYGDAGAIVTNNPALTERARMIANHGRLAKYDHQIEGRNSRLDALQAAILNAKLGHLDDWILRRNEIADRYRAGLGETSLVLPSGSRARHAYHLFVVRTPMRDSLVDHLSAAGVHTGIHYPIALPRLSAYGYVGQAEEDMEANRLADEVLSLPMGEHLTDANVDEICSQIREWERLRASAGDDG